MDGLVEGPFPTFIAGLPVWGTPTQVAEACSRAGGLVLAFGRDQQEIPLANVGHGDIVACSPPPIDPFDTFNDTQGMAVKFCEFDGTTACELIFGLRDRSSADARELREHVERKYGPGAPYDPEFSCSDPTDRQREFRLTWMFVDEVDGKRMPVGRIVLGFFCVPDLPKGRASLSLVYQNALGYMVRIEEAEQRRNSF